ncbi:hypothetical protein [Streptomyces sp. NRRL F-5123]|uniref:hypothetical protein n=1 Tax=Streptomyces sp. NRRL F-5123 TaxID=1463856 RepID=UPI0004E18DAD|nr:hypothetical protein [Streptomyces sp. NRRL F-5123]
MAAGVGKLVGERVVQMESGSDAGYRQAMSALSGAVREGLPGSRKRKLDAAIEALAPVLPLLSGDFAKTAVLAGAMVGWGGSPMPRTWVAAATTGDPALGAADPAIRAFRLFDGHGAYVHPGSPASTRWWRTTSWPPDRPPRPHLADSPYAEAALCDDANIGAFAWTPRTPRHYRRDNRPARGRSEGVHRHGS